MAPNDHLLEKFNAQKDTHQLAQELLLIAQVKTGPGSGRNIGDLSAGLPAACILLASERLKTGEFTEKIQKSSSLKLRDFRRVYEAAKAGIMEHESESCVTYKDLYTRYKLEVLEEYLEQYVAETENGLILLGYDSATTLFRCAVFFWVIVAIKPKALPTTEIFAVNHRISLKMFVNLLNVLNSDFLDLRKRIQAEIKAKKMQVSSPVKASATALATRQSPRKVALRDLPSKDATKDPEPQAAAVSDEPGPSAPRITRSMTSSPVKATPTKRGPERSPTKVAQLPAPRHLPWKKPPLRVLPSKDTPKKRVSEGAGDQMDVDQLPETPTKKRKVEPRYVSPTPEPLPSPSRITRTAAPIAGIFPPSIPAPSRLTETAPTVIPPTLLDVLSSDDDEAEEPAPKRRFRPVYLDHKQWFARDPRVVNIWKKIDKKAKGPTQVARSPKRADSTHV